MTGLTDDYSAAVVGCQVLAHDKRAREGFARNGTQNQTIGTFDHSSR